MSTVLTDAPSVNQDLGPASAHDRIKHTLTCLTSAQAFIEGSQRAAEQGRPAEALDLIACAKSCLDDFRVELTWP